MKGGSLNGATGSPDSQTPRLLPEYSASTPRLPQCYFHHSTDAITCYFPLHTARLSLFMDIITIVLGIPDNVEEFSYEDMIHNGDKGSDLLEKLHNKSILEALKQSEYVLVLFCCFVESYYIS